MIPQISLSIGDANGKKLLSIPGDKPFELFEKHLSEAAAKELKGLKEATQRIEGIFVKDILKIMLPKGFGGSGPMGDFARENFLNTMSEVAAKSGGMGMAKMLEDNLAESIYRREAARLMSEPTKEQP
ncbi:MAG: hypothetical protein JNK63_06955 [Chthonomonas sp.]|nr:hypothetical protein [Chthonomonas sp.]